VRALLAVVILSSGLLVSAPQAAAQARVEPEAGASSPPRTVFRNGQRTPTRERYREIQAALKEHGFDPGPVDGQWGPKTSAALKRFERANNLRADGQLDSLALIVLGLGPKRLSSIARNAK